MGKSKWNVDFTHSSIDFTIKHMMIANVKGTFHTFEALIEADPQDLTSADIAFNIDLASIDTRNADRDNHLRTGDFFEIEKYPTLSFKAASIVRTGEGKYDVTGEVQLHGVTRSETFAVIFEGAGKDPSGKEIAGFSAKGVINRSNYGLTYNAALETGGVLISDEVQIIIEIELNK
ncbi:YceI family protein [Paenibacillus sp. NPDC058071]|uniref:YceI family protein n=1 Tax=Paenibacillus sp. NPDC058071 TaxID=3346326 RepID=UPI0036D8CF8A